MADPNKDEEAGGNGENRLEAHDLICQEIQYSEANIEQDEASSATKLLFEDTREAPSVEQHQIAIPLPKDSNEYSQDYKKEPQQLKPSVPPLRVLPLRKRLTSYLVFVLITSTLLLLVAVAFLTFLYYGNRKNPTWRAIVLANWTTRAITLTGLVLRIAVSLQACVATSMLASLLIEGPGVLLQDAPEISISRFTNNGPHTFFRVYMKQPKRLSHILLFLVSLSTSLAIQISSTLLLSDVNEAAMAAPARTSALAYGFLDPFQRQSQTEGGGRDDSFTSVNQVTQNYWAQSPSTFQAFGEYSSPSVPVDGVDDTGLTIRSMIPLSSQEERENLINYTGPAFSYDARVVCTQPVLSKLAPCGINRNRICGQVEINTSVKGLIRPTNSIPFNYSLSLSRGYDTYIEAGGGGPPDSPWMLCGLNTSAGGLISILDPTNNASLTHIWTGSTGYLKKGNWAAYNGDILWPVDLGNAFLLLNLTANVLANLKNSSKSSYSGPWTDILVPNDYPSDAGWISDRFRASLCYDAIPQNYAYAHLQDFNVSLLGEGQRKEPTFSWDSNSSSFDTSAGRRQLGVSSERITANERGILQLSGGRLLNFIAQQRSEWFPLKNTSDAFYPGDPYQRDHKWFNVSTYPWVSWKVFSTSMDDRLEKSFCLYCYAETGTSTQNGAIDVLQASIFNHVLNDTGSPARALQAQSTILLRMAYYSSFPLFNAKANATTTSFVILLAPVSARGYWIVIDILCLHFSCYFITTILFLMRSRYSLLGNAWPSIAQIAGVRSAHRILQDNTLATDDEVAHFLKREENGKLRYRITTTGAEIYYNVRRR